MISQRDGSGTLRTPKTWTQRDASGTLRTLKEIWMRDASGVARKIFSGFKASASPTSVVANGGAAITTASTVTVTGGTAPFTYAWTQPTPDADWTALYPSNASTQFQYSGGDPAASTAWICTVTDATGATAVTNSVLAHYRDISGHL